MVTIKYLAEQHLITYKDFKCKKHFDLSQSCSLYHFMDNVDSVLGLAKMNLYYIDQSLCAQAVYGHKWIWSQNF